MMDEVVSSIELAGVSLILLNYQSFYPNSFTDNKINTKSSHLPDNVITS
jgi:hypothetical protein